MSKYTQGPWSMELRKTNHPGVNVAFEISSNSRVGICGGQSQEHLSSYKIEEDECRANSHLIAASPELYEALKRLHDSCVRLRFDGIKETDAEANARMLLERLEGLV